MIHINRIPLKMIILLWFISMVYASQIHPTCSWQCDNPTCVTQPKPICRKPVCHVECSVGYPELCSPPSCYVECPSDGASLDSCPTCETICAPPVCPPTNVCTVLCEQTNCDWKPVPCKLVYPKCERVCGEPACVYSGGVKQGIKYIGLLLVFLL